MLRAKFVGVVAWAVMEIAPFPSVFLCLLVTLLFLWLGRVVRGWVVLTLSFVLQTKVTFALFLRLIHRSELALVLLLEFLLNFDNITISDTQRRDVEELHFGSDVPMQVATIF